MTSSDGRPSPGAKCERLASERAASAGVFRLGQGQYYGTSNGSLSVAGITLTETVHNAGVSLPRHAHDWPYFCLVLRGRWQEEYERRVRICQPLTVIFHPPGECHADDFTHESARCFSIELGAEWHHRLALPGNPMDVQGGPAAWVGLRLYAEYSQSDDFSALAVEGLVLELLVTVARTSRNNASGPRPRWLRVVLDRLDSVDQPLPTITELSRLAGVHPVHLARVFRHHCGSAPARYLRQRRLDYACRLLEATADPIAEISLKAGFSDQSHFTKAFRQQFGVAPAAFRASLRRAR